ncbi:flagellar hook-associated protein FlgL [Melaminivora jejuensis]|uniref:flagellin N-terminal helical domain-containing protein n=1 Tax=Melaminivora jejuensis TaxID=1267217 RepID=UPI001ADFFA29|nr:flagellar hook-associated protein 3 [Melaminivora jejuensis]UHJ64653.1 flagellar hook-associated protein 3 [Melaminivora jejuensis]
MSTLNRVGTANLYDNTLRNLAMRQKNLTDLQESLTAGKRVVRASDDPVAAAQAERALTRISRIQAEQRQLDVQRGAMALAESTLGDAVGLVQEMRQLIIAAGSGTLKPEDRRTYANQIASLREQLSETINRKDANGVPLLGALGSDLRAFAGPLLSGSADYVFAGLPGQQASSGTSIATTVDGHGALMFDVQRDGVFHAAVSNGGAPVAGRHFGTDAVRVTNPELLQQPAPPASPYTYSIKFTGATNPPNPDGSYDIGYEIFSTNSAYVSPGLQPLNNIKPGQLQQIPISITDPGGATLEFTISATSVRQLDGSLVYSPADGDTVTLSASPSLMSTIDRAVRELTDAPDTGAAAQAVGQALAQLDKGMERLHNMRSYAGELLNRADRIGSDQENRAIQHEADRSRAEDLDMVKGISDFQNAHVGYQAALQSYAQVQRMSLLDFMR